MHISARSVRRRSLPFAKHRRLISLSLAAVLVGSSAFAVSSSGAATTTTAAWNLPFPRTMNYHTLAEDPAVQCKQTDSVFEQELAAARLDTYEIYVAGGFRGTCGRLKSEQLKRLYPAKMVIQYENAGGASPLQWPGGTWAGYYLMMNRTTATGAVNGLQTSIPVADPSVFSVGDTAVMWAPTAADAYANSEWVRVDAIVGSTLDVTRNLFATGARSYSSPPLIAAEATGPSYPNPVFNLSDVAPVNPANGERANQWMAANMVNDFAPSTAGAPTLDAVEFDTTSWAPPANNIHGATKNFDCNGDGVVDYCNQGDNTAQQVNSYGVGLDEFLQAVRQGLTQYDTDPNRPPKMVLADGEMGLRSISNADGVEYESFPSWDNYTYSSPALETLGVWESKDTAPGPHLSYAFTKDNTPLYPQVSSANPTGCIVPADGGTCRNGEYRYGMVSALLWGGASSYNNEASFAYAQPWDEEATINQATTGLAPGYLGQPIGPVTRTFRYSSPNLTVNPSFEQDLTSAAGASVVNGAVTVSRDTTTAAPGWGSASLRVDVTGQTDSPQAIDTRVSTDLTGPTTPGEYTVAFWAKGVSDTAGPQALNIAVGLDGATGAPSVVLLTNTWTHYFLQINATTTVTKPSVKFFLGTQIGTYWLDGVKVEKGTAGIMTRQFTNGIVVLNDSFSPQTNVALPGGTYHHIAGVQDRTVNDGTDVGSILPTIAAKDGEILLPRLTAPPR